MTTNYAQKGTPLIRNSNIKEGLVDRDDMVFLSSEFAKKYKHRQLQKNDIVTVHTGDIGTSAVIGDDLIGAQGFATLNTRVSGAISADYLCCFFNSKPFKDQAYSVSTGDGRNNLNMKDFVRLLISFPKSHSEQSSIVRILRAWDEAIAVAERLIAALRERRRGLMQRLLTGQVRVQLSGN